VRTYRQADERNDIPLTLLHRFRVRFKSFVEQYELRELHFHSMMRTKELEVQYHMARFEREKKSADAESTKARHLQSQVQAFTKTETELRNQLNVYVDKFKQVGCSPATPVRHLD
jgi:STE24 endopeptidase